MQITTTARAPWTILTIEGRLDNAGADTLRDTLLPLLTAGGYVAIDCAKMDYITSSGFRVLLQAEKEQRKAGGRLLVAHLTPSLVKFFEIAGLHTVLRLVPDLDAAIAGEA